MPAVSTGLGMAAGRLLLTLALLGAGSLDPPASADPATQAVTVDQYAFAPAELFVLVGTTVTWTNAQPDVPHTITSSDGLWDSGPLATGDSFAFTFGDVGDFAYACSIHPSMTGLVHVVADASELPATAAPATATPVASTPPTSSAPAASAPATATAAPSPMPPANRTAATSTPALAPTAAPYRYGSY